MFVARISRDIGREITIAPAAEALLFYRQWRGEVRQPYSVLMEAVVQADGSSICQVKMGDVLDGSPDSSPSGPRWMPTLDQAIDQVTRETIERALAASGGNKAEAAKLLGISTSSLYRYRRELGLE